MTSLLVKSEQMSLAIDLSSLTTMSKMSDRQFYEFCRTNPDLRIERNANGEIIVMPPAFADTGNLNGRVFGQLFVWSEADARIVKFMFIDLIENRRFWTILSLSVANLICRCLR